MTFLPHQLFDRTPQQHQLVHQLLDVEAEPHACQRMAPCDLFPRPETPAVFRIAMTQLGSKAFEIFAD